jgi:hypothetical protein
MADRPKLTTVTIDGKKGTIAYFDAAGQMTTPDKAVQAKVVFADGSHLWLRSASSTP